MSKKKGRRIVPVIATAKQVNDGAMLRAASATMAPGKVYRLDGA